MTLEFITQEKYEEALDSLIKEAKRIVDGSVDTYQNLRDLKKEYDAIKEVHELEFFLNKGAPSYRFKNDDNSQK